MQLTSRQWLIIAAATMGVLFMVPRKAWSAPAAADPYLADINAASDYYKLPPNLLARLLYQESHFRADIISGETKSKAGAIGIAQIIPRWHPGVNPYNPTESIYYAASYLYHLHQQFKRWDLALAAYNLGPTGVNALDGDTTNQAQSWDLLRAPKETRDYVAQILSDVPVTA